MRSMVEAGGVEPAYKIFKPIVPQLQRLFCVQNRVQFFFEISVYQICHLFLLVLHGVLVDVLEHIVCGMPHSLHRIFVWHIQGQHDGSISMTQIVKPVMWQPGSFAKPGKPLIHGLPA